MSEAANKVIPFDPTRKRTTRHELVQLSGPPIMPAVPPSCSRCKGAGYVRYDVPYGHRYFGRSMLCECKMGDLINKVLPLDYREYSFATFPASGDQTALLLAKTFAQQELTVNGIWLHSETTGTGKTGLACCILKYAIEHRETGMYALAEELYQTHVAISTGNADQEALQPYFDTPWLVVDDIGAEKASDTAIKCWLKLIEKRRGKYTVFTSNFSYDELAQRWRAVHCEKLLINRVIDRLEEQYYPQQLAGKIRQRCY